MASGDSIGKSLREPFSLARAKKAPGAIFPLAGSQASHGAAGFGQLG